LWRGHDRPDSKAQAQPTDSKWRDIYAGDPRKWPQPTESGLEEVVYICRNCVPFHCGHAVDKRGQSSREDAAEPWVRKGDAVAASRQLKEDIVLAAVMAREAAEKHYAGKLAEAEAGKKHLAEQIVIAGKNWRKVNSRYRRLVEGVRKIADDSADHERGLLLALIDGEVKE
jgi:hypothetical protein